MFGALVVIFSSTFSFHTRYKAEISARVGLQALVDEIDTEVIIAANAAVQPKGGTIDDKFLRTWMVNYDAIMKSYTKASGESFKASRA